MPSSIVLAGQRLGTYQVKTLLGVGGMGEVYLAHDSKLGRDVAVKVLPSALVSDPDRSARFEREARVLASLNHPNIASIYGFEREGDVPFLVLELVPGDTIAERLGRGAMPVAETLAVARQVVGALEAAHQRGIVHRDLKPANIKITPDDVVKVLDFGLAKLVETSEAGGSGWLEHLSQSPTITTPAVTRAGVILGTAAYMAPEQARI